MNIKKSIVLRARIAFLAIFLFSVAIMGKLVKVQVVEGEKWRAVAQENMVQYRKVKATRGNIYSDNGSLLATSLPFYKVAFDPSLAKEEVFRKGVDSLSLLLSRFFKDKSKEGYKMLITQARQKKSQYLVLNSRKINYQAKKEMSSWPVFREGRLKGGIIFEKADLRFRPFSHLAERTIGKMYEEHKGSGLEYSFNDLLAGRDGEALFRRIAGGTWKPMTDGSHTNSEEGLDIETTIDINLQDVAAASLQRHLTMHDADYGCVVLMEVKTGEIKAMVNLGRSSQGGYEENYNYAVGNQGLIEPGSTFKLASMIALFENTNLKPTDTIVTGQGEYEFYDRVMADSKPGGYGTITVQEAFEKSSNIAVAKLVNHHFGVAPEKYLENLDRCGLSRPLGFQMKGEAIPFIKKHTDKSWSGITLPWMSIGYELKLSPLHILSFYNGFANNGKMIRPVIVKNVRKADKVKKEFKTEVIVERLCSDQTQTYLRDMLLGVVERGTAKNISGSSYKIAGKTGTAQKLVNGRYTKNYCTSFVGYFPANNPKYSCIVVIDNPKGFKRYGSDVAAPVFRELADKVFANDLELHAPVEKAPRTEANGTFPVIRAGWGDDLRLICNEIGVSNHTKSGAQEWVVATTEGNSVYWRDKPYMVGLVPDVSGMTLRDAIYILENAGLRVRYNGKGRVVSQTVLAGTRINKGEWVELTLN